MPAKKSKFPPKKTENPVIKPRLKLDWSPFQKAVFKNIATGSGHLIIEAYAGASKTTTIVESFRYVPKGKKSIALAFNKKIQEELQSRAPSYIDTLTFHSLGLRAIKQRFGNVELDDRKVFFLVKDQLPAQSDYDLINNICDTIAFCKYGLLDTPNQVDEIIDRFGIDLCEMERKQFISIVLKTLGRDKLATNTIDFNDMCWLPFVYNLPLGQYDYVYIDERQDLNKSQLVMAKKVCRPVSGRIIAVGDENQCVDENTMIFTNNGYGKLPIKELMVGDDVFSFENGKGVYKKIVNKHLSDWKYGFKITTKSGKTLTMSPNHKIWAEQQEVDNKFLVYLMYRSDMGFRVGKTNKWKAKSNPFGARALHEQADKLWVLDVVDTNEEAIFLEEYYSLEFGIPTAVFNAAERGLNQDRINKIFSIFGQNGMVCLDSKYYSFNHPHWVGRSMSASNKARLVVRISAHHTLTHSSVNLELSDENIISLLKENGITGKFYKRRESDLEHFCIRKRFYKYTDALLFAQKLSNLTGAFITENLSFGKEDDLRLLVASELFVGMKVIISDNNTFTKDEIISIEKVPGTFYDIEVEDSNNFVGNDILSHNSLYSWRLADTTIIEEIKNQPGTQTLPLPISYRCPKSVINLAKYWVPDISCPDTAGEGEISDISINEMYKMAKPGCFILSRTNAPLIKICMNFIRNGVKANIRGRDVGQQLNSLIRKSKKKQIPAFISWLDDWKKEEVDKLLAKNMKTDNILDRYECLVNLCDECSSLKEVSDKIDELFDDSDENNIIILSTVHRAKGLERDDVFLLRWTFRAWFDQMEDLERPNEEANIAYVAVTRSKKRLFIVQRSVV